MIVDKLDKAAKWLFAPVGIVAVVMAAMVLWGVGAGPAYADTSQVCGSGDGSAPSLRNFVNGDSYKLFGFTEDHGRTTLTFYWSGCELRPAVVQIGHVVQGEWVPFVADVKFDKAALPNENQLFAYLFNGNPQLVSMTTVDAKPGDHIEARAFWPSRYFQGYREVFTRVAQATLEDASER